MNLDMIVFILEEDEVGDFTSNSTTGELSKIKLLDRVETLKDPVRIYTDLRLGFNEFAKSEGFSEEVINNKNFSRYFQLKMGPEINTEINNIMFDSSKLADSNLDE
jgi:hypothetical protein